MSDLAPLIARFRELTTPSEQDLAVMMRELDWEAHPDEVSSLRPQAPHPGALVELEDRILATTTPEARRSSSGWLVLAGATLAAVAAVVLFATQSTETELDTELVAQSTTESQLLPEVRATYQGKGKLTGTTTHAKIEWNAGEIALAVKPDRNITVEVTTAEGTGRVTGTQFTVKRDKLGTIFAVTEGTVEVTCLADGQATPVHRQEDRQCLPVTAPGLLARALALRTEGTTDQVAATATEGLNTASGAIRGELLNARMFAYIDLQRFDDALADADAYLAEDYQTRRETVLEAAARVAYKQGGCSTAQRYVVLLPTHHDMQKACP
jgi:hypothetical protein